ncbi:MAG: hypothetical protein ACKVQS_03520 [Fimbriimonadaceae bacterium]
MKLFNRMARAGRKKWILGCAASFLIFSIIAVVGILQVVDFPIVANRADAVVAEYKAAGLPWTRDDLDTELPEEKNGADFIREAMSLSGGNIESQQLELRDLAEIEKWAEVSTNMQKQSAVFESLRKASACEGLDFHRDWDKGSQLLFPEFASIKGGVRLLTLQAELSARNGKLESALGDLSAAFRLGSMISEEPILIAMLVGISSQTLALESALKVASVRQNDSNWIKRVRKAVEGWECEYDFDRAMEGEGYLGLAMIRNIKGDAYYRLKHIDSESEGNEYFYDDANRVRTGIPKRMTNAAFAVRWMEAQIYVHKLLKESNGDNEEIGKKFDEYLVSLEEPPKKLSNLFNEFMFPVFSPAGAKIKEINFKVKATQAALAAAESKAMNGSYPKSLSEMGVSVIDPITGGDAHYLVRDFEVTIYSVGRNKVDDLGERYGVSKGDDIAARFPPRSRLEVRSITPFPGHPIKADGR